MFTFQTNNWQLETKLVKIQNAQRYQSNSTMNLIWQIKCLGIPLQLIWSFTGIQICLIKNTIKPHYDIDFYICYSNLF